jgi:hypothetical protein
LSPCFSNSSQILLSFDFPHCIHLQITKHWSNNEKPEMTLERLQLIATAVAPHHHKARWLSFWNSSIHTREALHFPAKGFKTNDLESWLKKASFWAGVRYFCPSLIHLAYSFTRYYCSYTMISYLVMYYLHLVIYFVPLVYDSTVRGRFSSNACEDH